ncbi:hypothetical protein BJ322DRAFT_684234 [Thelephora terrestris]|uniref:Uncharacterized protein n=1 Tax=Thelephora terrestris TaxID=56493 RepID=A0A9P6L885_9AGAM|nr:hypothetical protein BJ322DRAFT_684234 [Thelephora terrestris]
MVRRHAIPDADVTITHHLPPQEDDSTRDFSMSFAIPAQADASNLLDQSYEDFFSGPGLVTLSTPVLPRHLANAIQSVRKPTRTIQTPPVLSDLNFARTLTTDPTTELEPPDYRTELQEAHIPHHTLPSLLPRKRPPTGPARSTVNTTSIVNPGPPRPAGTTSKSNPDLKIYNSLTSNSALSTTPILTTQASGTRPSIQSLPTHDTQISHQPPKTAAQKNEVLAHPRGNTGVDSNRTTSRSRGGDDQHCETATCTQSRDRGGAARRPNSTLSNNDFGRVNGRTRSSSTCANSRGNVTSRVPHTGDKHSDPDSLDECREEVTQSLVKRVLPSSATAQSGLDLELSGAEASDTSPPLGPPRTGGEVSREEEEADRLTVSHLSPSKTVRGCPEINKEHSGPMARVPLAISPMRPSKKRASSAGQASDNEPDGAMPDELEKQRLITQSNREGDEGKGTRRIVGEKKSVASCKRNGESSVSLAVTRRLKAKAVRESPRVRKLRDKLAGRVSGKGGAGRRAGAPKVSRGGGTISDARGFSGKAGASTTASVAMVQGKGADVDETTGRRMPYSGDNVSFVVS